MSWRTGDRGEGLGWLELKIKVGVREQHITRFVRPNILQLM